MFAFSYLCVSFFLIQMYYMCVYSFFIFCFSTNPFTRGCIEYIALVTVELLFVQYDIFCLFLRNCC